MLRFVGRRGGNIKGGEIELEVKVIEVIEGVVFE